VEKLADEFAGKVEIVKVNIDQQRDLAQKFQVRSIPSLFFMESNKIKSSLKGMTTETELRKRITALA
jgi:thioredoxin 1